MILSMLTCFENMQADGRVLTGVEMKELTTMRVGGKADCVVFAGSVEDVRKTVQLCRENDIPLFSLESRTPLKEFDLLGATLQYEMSYTNVLNMLDVGTSWQSACQGMVLIISLMIASLETRHRNK